MATWRHGEMETGRHQRENGSPGNFFNPFTVCSSYKQKFVIRPFVDKETNESHQFDARLCIVG
jgi:hypothetical protein